MRLNTCSEGISYARELEQASAALYEEAAAQYPEVADTLRGYAAANKKNVSNVERAYYGVITDAIEGCFAFDLDPDEYSIDATLPEGTALPEFYSRVIAMEEIIDRFYIDAAEQSKGLMADVPRAFNLVAKKRGHRVEELKSRASA